MGKSCSDCSYLDIYGNYVLYPYCMLSDKTVSYTNIFNSRTVDRDIRPNFCPMRKDIEKMKGEIYVSK